METRLTCKAPLFDMKMSSCCLAPKSTRMESTDESEAGEDEDWHREERGKRRKQEKIRIVPRQRWK